MNEPQTRPTSSFLRWSLVLLAVCILCAAAWFCRPQSRSFYTDAAVIKEPLESAKIRDILWQPPHLLTDAVNDQGDEYEPRTSSDGMTLYFVRGKAGENADIYYCNRIPGGWGEALPLSVINSEYDDLGPEPSADLRALYFYSDRPGGHGSYDVWVSFREEGTWQAPVNLGPAVNSGFNEYGPAISAQHNWLYFASNRPSDDEDPRPHPDAWPATVREDLYIRDYDLYVARLVDDEWTPATAVHVLNSPFNEGTPALSPVGDFLYFSSDRPGGAGGFDLYRARLLRHHPGAPDHLGWTVNSAAHDLDPALTLDGFGLFFSSDRSRRAPGIADDYDLYYTASREVFVDDEHAATAFAWSAFLQQVLPSLLWALLALLLLLMLLWLMRGEFYRRLSLIMRCLLISLMLHFLLLLMFSVWQVSTRLAELVQREGGVKVALQPPAGSMEIARQLRGRLTNLEDPQPPVTSVPRRPAEYAVSHVRTRAELDVAAERLEFTDASLAVPRVRESDRADALRPSAHRQMLEPAAAHILPLALPVEQGQAEVPEAIPEEPPDGLEDRALAKVSPALASMAPAIRVEMETLENRRPIDDSHGLSQAVFQEPKDLAPDPPMNIAGAVEALAERARPLGLRPPLLPQPGPEQSREAALTTPAPPAGRPLRRMATANPPQAESPVVDLAQLEPAEVAGAGQSIMTMAMPLPSDRSTPATSSPTLRESEAATKVAAQRLPEPALPRAQDAEAVGQVPTAAADVDLLARGKTPKRAALSPGPEGLPVAIAELAPDSQTARDHRSLARPVPLDTADRKRHEIRSTASDSGAPVVPTLNLDLALPAEVAIPTEAYAHREPVQREKLITDMGGSEQTEYAVALALQWLSNHQSPDGRWDADHYDAGCGACPGRTQIQVDNALTGLALLCFLSAGHTHTTAGPYQEGIGRALDWLLGQQDANGDLRSRATMYSHAIATMALAEALGMTGDPRLTDPVQRATDFIVRARHRGMGGWRYDPGQFGDTSVLGWQVMALRSAEQAGVDVAPEAYESARQWLDRVSTDAAPGLYAYQPGRGHSASMTAEALFAQHLLGRSREERRMQQSVRYITRFPPDWESGPNTYFWYYATLALYQHQGPQWQRWNKVLVAELLEHQHQEGPAAGSWDLTDRWSNLGGRVYQTAMCTLMLEVYYRYLPLYLSAAGAGGSGEAGLAARSEPLVPNLDEAQAEQDHDHGR